MKAPEKPKPPIKPTPPNKKQTVHKHYIDVSSLFSSEVYYDVSGEEVVEITEEKYLELINDPNYHEYDMKYESDIECYAPSLSQFIDLIPKGISLKDIKFEFINPYIKYNGNEVNIVMFYETPFDYNLEKNKYDLELAEYTKELKDYNEFHIPNYKKQLEKYKAKKMELSKAKKKAKLEAELEKLK